MPIKNIIPGQVVTGKKVQRSRELRQEMTPAEKILWRYLRGNKLGGLHFRRQQIVAGYIVDFFCHKASLVVEVDGGIHLQQKDYDAERDEVFKGLGLQVLHVQNEEVLNNLSSVLKKIQDLMNVSD